MEIYENYEDKKKRKKRRMIVYMMSCCCFILPIALILILALIIPSSTTTITITCVNQTGSCPNPNYKAGVNCNVNDTVINSNGGTACTTLCNNEIESYKCKCPAKKIWEQSLVTCSMICLNETIMCTNYTSDSHCVAVTDTNKGYDCKTICNDSTGSFECSCNAGFQWDEYSLSCKLICVNKTGNCASSDYMADVQCVFDNNVETASWANKCTTLCETDLLSYKCLCSQYEIWDQNSLSCLLVCQNGTVSSCEAYPDIQTCLHLNNPDDKIDTCTSICNNSIGSYTCTCKEYYRWEQETLTCPMKCESSSLINCTAIPGPSVRCVDPPPKSLASDLNFQIMTNCSAFCSSQSTNLDYVCTCFEPHYHWTLDHACIMKCFLGIVSSCNVYAHGSICNDPSASNDIDSCTSNCNGGLADYTCTCKFSKSWNQAAYQCL